MKICLILLAAGNSRRFGSNKLLYQLKNDGKPMYRYVVEEMARMTHEKIFAEKIVVSQYEEILEDLAAEGWTAVKNTEPERGISRSLQLGIIQSLQREKEEKSEEKKSKDKSEHIFRENVFAWAEQKKIDAWCFIVADQPYLTAETIENFVHGFQEAFQKEGKTCGCVKYGEQMGNPCIFSSVHKKELLELTGDVGGKKVLKRHLNECYFYEVKEKKELEDIDCI